MCRCVQHAVIGSASEMRSIAESKLARSCETPIFVLEPDQRKALASFYANKCLALWHVIMTLTKAGRDNPLSFPYEEFVTAALHVFETGLTIRDDDPQCSGYSMEIVQKDALLSSCPVTDWVEQELHSRISAFRRRNNVLKRACERIKCALTDAVTTERPRQSPVSLSIAELTFEGLDANVFHRPHLEKKRKRLERKRERERKEEEAKKKEEEKGGETMDAEKKR